MLLETTTAQWRSAAWRSYPHFFWEQECFLYHPSTGETHVLNAVAVQVLDLLAQGSLTGEELAARLELTPGTPEADALAAQLYLLANAQLVETS